MTGDEEQWTIGRRKTEKAKPVFSRERNVFLRRSLKHLSHFFLLFILISYRNPKHAEWAHSYIAALIELQQYCKEFHPIGVSWAAE